MKLVLTLLVRDEADVIDEHLDYHLHAGVDFIIATDHRSQDGTTEILESYARRGRVLLFREDGEFVEQGEWQTRMSRLAATDYGADWVIPSDCDEFWWPHAASLKDVLGAVPESFGCVRALSRTFVPMRDDSGWFGERLTLRLATSAPINDPASTFRPVVKVAHRGHPGVSIPGGAHQVFGVGSPMRGASPLEILHVPFRSRAQCAWKYERTWTGWRDNPRGDLARARALTEAGRAESIWDRVALDEDVRDRGLADGSLVTDTRLRDALRAVGGHRESPGADPEGFEVLRLGPPELADDVAYAMDLALFEEAEVVRVQRRLDLVEARLAALVGRVAR